MKNNIDNISRGPINLKAGLSAGFIASAVSLLVLGITSVMTLVPDFNYITIQGSVFGLTGAVLSSWIAYFLIGTFVWGSLYALMEPRLKGTTALQKGTMFGIIVWLIVMIVLMPLAGAGLFVKQFGFLAALIILITDLIFGAAIGHFYNKLR